jgi:hypothetical protein
MLIKMVLPLECTVFHTSLLTSGVMVELNVFLAGIGFVAEDAA